MKPVWFLGFFRAAHPFVFRLVWLLCRPTLRALVRFVPRATGLRRSCLVCVALRAGLVRLGGSAVHLQTPQVAALEAALLHDAARPPCVGAIACRLTWRHSKGQLVYLCSIWSQTHCHPRRPQCCRQLGPPWGPSSEGTDVDLSSVHLLQEGQPYRPQQTSALLSGRTWSLPGTAILIKMSNR